MPISDDRLYAEGNAYLLMPAQYTIWDALHEWSKGATRWGTPREWWWLVIEHEGAQFTAIPFEQLRDLLGQTEPTVFMSTQLGDLPRALPQPNHWLLEPGVVLAKTVDKEATTTTVALQLAEDSPGQVLVVTTQGQCVGIMSKRTRSFAMATLSLLKMLEADEQRSTHNSDAAPTGKPSTLEDGESSL